MRQHRPFGIDDGGCNTNHIQQRPDATVRCDRQIQTSPSDTPAAWPPPSVHGSPQRRRRIFEDVDGGGGRCECASASTRTREPTRRELYQWLSMSEPGARLFRAKYVYRPLRDSPNDNPETELSLTPGDYLLIFGDLDEDFYYRGELWTGERGLVPSNYVEPMSGGVLGLDSSSMMDSLPSLSLVQHRAAPAPSNRFLSRAASERAQTGLETGAFVSTATASVMRSAKSVDAFTAGPVDHPAQQQQSTSAVMSALSTLATEELWPSDASMCPFPVVDVSNVQVQEIRPFDGARVPCPRDLLVERQLTKSVLISWSPPLNALCPVAQYHVCVDGEVRAVVPAGYKTKALIEDVDSRKIHRISVRAVSDAGRSPDEACTATVGQGSVIRPQDLKVISVTPVSCDVSWYPSYSSCEHLVLLNGLKVGTCPAGVYRVQIRGLIPSTMYRSSIRVKDPKAVLEEKPVESYVDFKTLPKIGLPDPPSDVHCEPGPQDGTLLVTWRPVTTQPKPPSRAAVAGYLVYADGRKVCDVDSPSGDHAVLRLQDLNDDPPLFITVKTKTREGAVSSDSNVVRVPRKNSAILPSTHGDLLMLSSAVSPSTQVTKNATTQDLVCAVGTQGALTTTASPLPSSLVQFTATSTTAAEKTPYSTSTAPSYYVFHPRLASQRLDTAVGLVTGGNGPGQTLTVNVQEKPSLLEMETDYLSRHQQLQDRTVAYHPATSITTLAPSRLFQSQQQTGGMANRQSAFSRRSYSLDEAPPSDYDPFGPQPGAVPGLHPAANPVPGSFHPPKHIRTAFNGPQRINAITGNLPVDDTQWSEANPFRPAAKSNRFEPRTVPAQTRGPYWPQQTAYGDFDADTVGPAYDGRPTAGPAGVPVAADSRAKGALTSRHRRRLQDAADARAFSEPDLLHHDINSRYLLQQPPAHYHTRRHRSKTPSRLVVALYDYSPRHMSPNPNGHLDELPFRKGQLISVLGEKDVDGFYRGELEGRVGLVPSNLVVEVEGGVEAFLNSPPTSSMVMDYEGRQGYPAGGRYREGGRGLPRERYYGPSDRAYDEGGVWDSRNGGSDPLLSRTHQRHPAPMREQPHFAEVPAGASLDNAYERYSDTQDRYGTSRHRRNKYKQKSHSLEYDLDRRDYYDQEELPYERQSLFRPVATEYQSSRLAARSLDRFHYQRPQGGPARGAPEMYPAGQVERGRHQAASGDRHPWPSPRQQYREGSDQDSEAELLHYHRQQQQQRKPMAQPRRMSMFDQRQQQMTGVDAYGEQEGDWHPDDVAGQQFVSRQRGPAGGAYDRARPSAEEALRRGSRAYVGDEQLLAEARKKQPPEDLFYDSPGDGKDGGARRRDSLRRGGRHHLEQNIRDAVLSGAARRMVAKFDYDPKILSPNPGAEREELTFRAGDAILVYGDVDEDGFYVGELGNRRGLVPSNYLVREQDAGLSAMPNSMQMSQQSAALAQQALYDSQSAGTSRSKKESLVSFAPSAVAGDTPTPIGAQPSPSSAEKKVSGQMGKQPSSAPTQKTSSGAAGAKRQPGQLKKTDSTIGQKVPQKKVSVAGGPAPTRKASSAVGPGKGAGSSKGQEDGGIGKMWKKIVE